MGTLNFNNKEKKKTMAQAHDAIKASQEHTLNAFPFDLMQTNTNTKYTEIVQEPPANHVIVRSVILEKKELHILTPLDVKRYPELYRDFEILDKRRVFEILSVGVINEDATLYSELKKGDLISIRNNNRTSFMFDPNTTFLLEDANNEFTNLGNGYGILNLFDCGVRLKTYKINDEYNRNEYLDWKKRKTKQPSGIFIPNKPGIIL